MPTRRLIAAALGLLALPPLAWAEAEAPRKWTPAELDTLRRAFDSADRHALNPVAFSAALERGADARTAAAEAWARALALGLVNPASLHNIFTLERRQLDVVAGLRVARASGRLAEWLESLPPADAVYAALSQAYREEVQAPAAAPDLPSGPLVRLGGVDTRVPEIARRLKSRGFLADGARTGDPTVYGPEMQGAVRAFQADEALAADGVVGPDTLEALNLGPRDRARQLAVNLERRRWLERQAPATRIDVNIAAAKLTYVRDGQVVLTRRVVVGAPGHETPLLEAAFNEVVVNPPWYVPASIARRELLPLGPAYLRERNMRVRNGRVIQAPGPDSALGLVKFDMRNPYAIYLHDTPAKDLFAAPDRWRSHGCIRVDGAVDFARRLAAERGQQAAFEAALSSGETRAVDLGEEIPVRLLYLTAEPGDAGIIYPRDAYGWDGRLADRMALGPGRVRAPVRLSPDLLGP